MMSQKVFIKASTPTAESEHKQNRGIYFFSFQLLLAGLHSAAQCSLSLSVRYTNEIIIGLPFLA